MKKVFAKFLTLVLTITMLVSVMPSAFAEGEAVSLPTGNAAGRLTDGLTVKIGDGTDENMTATTLLTDGFHYGAKEKGVYGTAIADDSLKTIKLDNNNRIVEFSWNSAQTVKRLEMWMWRIGAVKDYKIQISDDGSVWTDYATGTLDQSQPVPVDTSSTRAIFHIIQFDAVTTKYLRFVIVNFRDNQSEVKIAEAMPRSSDHVNLLAKDTLRTDITTLSWFSAYFGGFFASNTSYDPTASNAYWYRRSDSYYWPCTETGNRGLYVTPSEKDGSLWYATDFDDSPQTINKIVMNIASGTVKEFQVLYSQKSSVSIDWTSATNPFIPCPDTNPNFEWKVATTVKGNFTASTGATAYIPHAPKAEYWMVKVTDKAGNVQLAPFEFYSLHQSTTLFGDGASFAESTNANILSDNYYHTKGQLGSDATISTNINKFAKFEKTNSGIQYSWEETQTVDRWDLWILAYGGVKDYSIESSNNGVTWNNCFDGTFSKYDGNSVDGSPTSYYPVVFENPVTAKQIRFVIKSFYNDSEGAYVAESKIYNGYNDKVNYGELGILPETATARNKRLWSPYLNGVYLSESVQGKGYRHTWGNGMFFMGYNNSTSTGGNTINITKDDDSLWYATGFDKSRVKVNRFGVTLAQGTVSELELWACVGTARLGKMWTDDPPCPASESFSDHSSWTKVATIECNLDTASDVVFDIPQSIEASGWMIRASQCSDNVQVSEVEMYTLADRELTPILGEGSIAIADDTVDAGEEATFSIFACNKNYLDAAVFFALYSGDTLIDAAKADMPISGIDTFEAKYTVPTNAEGELTLKAYLWDGKTLVPILNGPATK